MDEREDIVVAVDEGEKTDNQAVEFGGRRSHIDNVAGGVEDGAGFFA